MGIPVNFDGIEDTDDFTPVPEGSYPCEVTSVEEHGTQSGDDVWNVHLTILQGKYAGRKIFDFLHFTEKSLKRLKFVLARLGFPTQGQVELEPDMLVGRRAIVTITVEEYVDKKGKPRKRNAVPWGGYERIGDAPAQKGASLVSAAATSASSAKQENISDDELPF